MLKRFGILGICIISLFFLFQSAAFADTTIQTGNATNSVTIQNETNKNVVNIQCQCTPTPTPIIAQSTPTPTSNSQAIATPTTVTAAQEVATPTPTSVPAAASAPSQTVLGVSTMAPTGTFLDNMMDVVAATGIGMLIAGFVSMAYKKGFMLQVELQY